MGEYDGQIVRAEKLIKRRGQLVTVNRVSGQAFDPVAGELISTSSPYTGYAVELDYSEFIQSGSSIQSGDKKLIMEAVSAPRTGETITTASGTGTVVSAETLQPNGQQIIHTIQLRY